MFGRDGDGGQLARDGGDLNLPGQQSGPAAAVRPAPLSARRLPLPLRLRLGGGTGSWRLYDGTAEGSGSV